MARIAGINLPRNKRIEIALTYIYGIGRARARKILLEANIDVNTKTQDITETEEMSLRQIIEKAYSVEGELRREISQCIKVLRDIQSYRGTRHRKKLPARGQRSKTNSRTVRGNVRKTMGSGKTKQQKT